MPQFEFVNHLTSAMQARGYMAGCGAHETLSAASVLGWNISTFCQVVGLGVLVVITIRPEEILD